MQRTGLNVRGESHFSDRCELWRMTSSDDKLLQSECVSVHVCCELGRVEVNQQLFELPLQAIAEHSGNNQSIRAAHIRSKRDTTACKTQI
jgi:hypothetical protein